MSEPKSRSELRRIALQKGEEMPTFEEPTPPDRAILGRDAPVAHECGGTVRPYPAVLCSLCKNMGADLSVPDLVDRLRAIPPAPEPSAAEELARRFHEAYERLAPH
jgi:hypothetical protein